MVNFHRGEVEEIKEYVTISQLAKLFNISHHTIRHYEDKHIIKPAFIKENGYRMYGLSEAYDLAFILLFRNLNLGILEIKNLQETTEKETYELFLRNKILEIEQEINDLNQIKESIEKQLAISKQINKAEQTFLDQPIYLKKIKRLAHDEVLTINDLLDLEEVTLFFSSQIVYVIYERYYDVFYETKEELLDFIPVGKYQTEWLLAQSEKDLDDLIKKKFQNTSTPVYILEEVTQMLGKNHELQWKIMFEV